MAVKRDYRLINGDCNIEQIAEDLCIKKAKLTTS
jgi:hypothetical protein